MNNALLVRFLHALARLDSDAKRFFKGSGRCFIFRSDSRH